MPFGSAWSKGLVEHVSPLEWGTICSFSLSIGHVLRSKHRCRQFRGDRGWWCVLEVVFWEADVNSHAKANDGSDYSVLLQNDAGGQSQAAICDVTCKRHVFLTGLRTVVCNKHCHQQGEHTDKLLLNVYIIIKFNMTFHLAEIWKSKFLTGRELSNDSLEAKLLMAVFININEHDERWSTQIITVDADTTGVADTNITSCWRYRKQRQNC